jgi:putative transposase
MGRHEGCWKTPGTKPRRRAGGPQIFNTDQGSQFTGAAFTGVLIKSGIAISMDGKGAWRDNAFVERRWRSVKYEECISAPTTASARPELRSAANFEFNNGRRPHEP